MTATRHQTGRPPQDVGHYSPDGRRWFDEAGQRWLGVLDDQDALVITLEDVNAASWWASLLATLSSVMGNAYSRFVGRATSSEPGRPAYEITSPTFPRVRGLPDSMTPQEAWAPGMADALSELRRRLEAEGWREMGRGPEPWSYRYVRPRVDWPTD